LSLLYNTHNINIHGPQNLTLDRSATEIVRKAAPEENRKEIENDCGEMREEL
jgi:hypothetical protein